MYIRTIGSSCNDFTVPPNHSNKGGEKGGGSEDGYGDDETLHKDIFTESG